MTTTSPYERQQSARRPPTTAPGAGWDGRTLLACAGLIGSVVFAVWLHLGPGRSLNPVRRTISDYVLVDGGAALFDGSVLCLVIGSAAVLAGLTGSGLTRGSRRTGIPLGAGCMALLLVVLFPTDPPGSPSSVYGLVHRYAGAVAFASLPLTGLLLVDLPRNPTCQGPIRRVRLLSQASAAGVVLFFATHLGATYPDFAGAKLVGSALGLTERLLLCMEIALLYSLADLVRLGRRPGSASRRGGSL
ncbi:DUF998 domain-containing protein [Streptomyces sp.]|uniref:DUF998 domain-containing protein n=1 Tax=Streptomyces sp. TaxID=1931 RepID=UPI002D7782DE|nr:DUF998 domain-containing protein [Streptomyces sp.]HET6355862.1 DUF998 domain-containing protein [Streptomyces sp.]